jgi:hypothetical protein
MGLSCKQAGALLAMTVCATAANAEGMTFDFGGFGTAGFAWADTNKAEFARDTQPTGADRTGDIGLDSLVGVQGTVHLTSSASYAVRKVISPTTDSTIPQVGPLLPLAFGVDALLAAHGQHTTSFGVRWDFHDSLDAKFQIDHVSPEGPGLLINVKPGFSGPVTVAALVVDFVF